MSRLPSLAGCVPGVLLALGLLRCGDGAREPEPPPPDAAGSDGLQSERARTLGPFLADYWRLPIAPQGEPPADFAQGEDSLDPALCGACHPQQYREWRSSLHARAYSPGLSGQLIEGPLADPAEIRQCQTCHAPLAEQQPFDTALNPGPTYDPLLQGQGIVCAACHVRSHRRFGPPRRAELPPAVALLPHGGFEARGEFQESRFCAACHQFFDDPGIAGKPVENTYAEWAASPQAARGTTCQGCHMPDRAHRWPGIHDAELVRSAVEMDLVPLDLTGETLRAALVLASREVGHAFPTYVTPRVFLGVWQVDRDRREIPGTRTEAIIGREIDLGASPAREVFDTRVRPGESVKLDYAMPRDAAAIALVGRVSVDPDFHYRGAFAALLSTLSEPAARERIAEALRRIEHSSYTLAEFQRPLGDGSADRALPR